MDYDLIANDTLKDLRVLIQDDSTDPVVMFFFNQERDNFGMYLSKLKLLIADIETHLNQ